MKKRHLLLVGLIAATALFATGCNQDSQPTNSDEFTIGVAVIVSHPALQAVQDGFEEVLQEAGLNYKLIEENAQGEQANAATIASTFAADQSIDLILAISTPIALAIASAEQDRPILFSAVTDPVRDGLVPSWEEAGSNITGTSDLSPGAAPVHLVAEAMPGVKTIGVLYSSSESNSLAQVEAFQEEAAELGITIKPQAVTSAAEISVGLETLADVDAILVPTDNTVVASVASVIGFGQEHQIPVFSVDPSNVAMGTVAARGLSYHDLGRRTGEMAVSILTGQLTLAQCPPEAPPAAELSVNLEAAASFGLTLPDDFVARAIIVTTDQ